MSASALSTSEYKGGNKLSEVSTGGRRKTRSVRKSRRGGKKTKRTNKRRSNRRRK
jgi:hypothetical protein